MNKVNTAICAVAILSAIGGYNQLDPIDANPIEAQKERIIESMNAILEQEKKEIPHESMCTILIEGNSTKGQLQVDLMCNTGIHIARVYNKPHIENYKTVVRNIVPSSNKNLSSQGSCLKMLSTDPNGDKRYITSLGCGPNT